MANHTPGPWIPDNGGCDSIDNMVECLTHDEGTLREWMAVGKADSEGYAESLAYCHPDNANLIAAAPEMLAALHLAYAALASRRGFAQGTTAATIRAVITKAEGRS